MCSFAAMEPVSNPSATTFALAIMKIILRYGFCHTVVLDKDSKFLGICREALDLLQINCHILSGNNHNPMLIKRINWYLNAGLRIMTNEQDSVRIALEAILLLIYAWNSCPVPRTDISCSLVAVGREFANPINFSAGKNAELTSAPGTIASYSRELASCLAACHKVALLLVKELRCMHRELINSCCPDPRVYSVGNIVFARHATRSDSKQGKVDKLMHPFTGPWWITGTLPGTLYALKYLHNTKRTDKLQTCHPTLLSLLPSSPLTAPTATTASYISPSARPCSKRQALRVSPHRNLFRLQHTSSQRGISMISIGLRYPS
jgi:hypothetical protein